MTGMCKRSDLIWNEGKVPYDISFEVLNDPHKRQIVEEAIEHVNSKTCVKLIQRQYQPDYVCFTTGKGCGSCVGRQGGRQDITLGAGCFHKGIIVHEIMHLLGFEHEHQRPDRNMKVHVFMDNIKQGKEHDFVQQPYMRTLGLPYDFDSIMHYGSTDFAKRPGLPTIMSLENIADGRMGQRNSLSELDIGKINKLYGSPIPRSALRQRNTSLQAATAPSPTFCNCS